MVRIRDWIFKKEKEKKTLVCMSCRKVIYIIKLMRKPYKTKL